MIARKKLPGQFEVGFGSTGSRIVECYRSPVTGRLRKPNVARNHRAEEAFTEILPQCLGDLLGQVGPIVVHGKQHALNGDGRIEGCADPLQCGDQLGNALQCEVLCLHGNDERVGGRQDIQCQQVERRRAIQDNQVEFVPDRLERLAKTESAVVGAGQLDICAGQILRSRQKQEFVDFRGEYNLGRGGIPHQYVVDGVTVIVALDSEARRSVGLGVAVHKQRFESFESEAGSEVYCSSGLANPTLLVDNTKNLSHGFQEYRGGRFHGSGLRCGERGRPVESYLRRAQPIVGKRLSGKGLRGVRSTPAGKVRKTAFGGKLWRCHGCEWLFGDHFSIFICGQFDTRWPLFHVEHSHLELTSDKVPRGTRSRRAITARMKDAEYNSFRFRSTAPGTDPRNPRDVRSMTERSDLQTTNAFIGRIAQPTADEISTALGSTATVWIELVGWLAKQGAVEQEWKSSSAKYGWSLLLKKKKRTILYIGPCDGCFRASLVLGDRAVAAARQSDLSSSALKLLDEAPRYAEGTGLRLIVKSLKDLPTIRKLALIKLAN